MHYGIQMYSVRDLAKTDLRLALKLLAELGYRRVEFAGFFGHAASSVAAWLKEYRLSVCSTHTHLRLLREDFGSVVRYHHDIGCDLLIVPSFRPADADDLKRFAREMTDYRTRLRRDGIALAYHNHAFDFDALFGGASTWDTLYNDTLVALELDTYWAYVGKQDPVQWMQTLHAQRRLPVIHLKDGSADGKGMPLGRGTAPVQTAHRTALELGIPIIVESDTCNPSGIEEARMNIEYLQTLSGAVPV